MKKSSLSSLGSEVSLLNPSWGLSMTVSVFTKLTSMMEKI